MDVPNWLIGLGIVLLLALVAGWGLVAFNVSTATPPENRPAPTGLLAANEQARIESLKRVAARHRRSV